MEKVSPPTDPRCFTLGMQSFPCGRKFSQCVEKASLPIGLPSQLGHLEVARSLAVAEEYQTETQSSAQPCIASEQGHLGVELMSPAS